MLITVHKCFIIHQGYLDDSRKEPVDVKEIEKLCNDYKELELTIFKEHQAIDFSVAALTTRYQRDFNELLIRVLKVSEMAFFSGKKGFKVFHESIAMKM